jgi:hypothetical protein
MAIGAFLGLQNKQNSKSKKENIYDKTTLTYIK